MKEMRVVEPVGDTGSLQRVYRIDELPAITGFKNTDYIHQLVRKGQFPRPIKLGVGRSIGWLEQDLVRWQGQRIAERDSKAAA